MSQNRGSRFVEHLVAKYAYSSQQSTENNTIEALRGVVDIDDDNEPAPEDVPRQGEASDRVLGAEWGHDSFCYR